MSSTNIGNQLITNRYKQPFNAKSVNRQFAKTIRDGIYKIPSVSIIDDSTVEITSFSLWILDDLDDTVVKVDITETFQVSVAPLTNFVIARFQFQTTENNFLDIIGISEADIQPNDIIIAKCDYTGVSLTGLDFSVRTVPLTITDENGIHLVGGLLGVAPDFGFSAGQPDIVIGDEELTPLIIADDVPVVPEDGAETTILNSFDKAWLKNLRFESIQLSSNAVLRLYDAQYGYAAFGYGTSGFTSLIRIGKLSQNNLLYAPIFNDVLEGVSSGSYYAGNIKLFKDNFDTTCVAASNPQNTPGFERGAVIIYDVESKTVLGQYAPLQTRFGQYMDAHQGHYVAFSTYDPDNYTHTTEGSLKVVKHVDGVDPNWSFTTPTVTEFDIPSPTPISGGYFGQYVRMRYPYIVATEKGGAGRLYIFKDNGSNNWSLVHTITPTIGSMDFQLYGQFVPLEINDNYTIAVLEVLGNEDGAGSVVSIYTKDAGLDTWSKTQTIYPQFGAYAPYITLNDDTLILWSLAEMNYKSDNTPYYDASPLISVSTSNYPIGLISTYKLNLSDGLFYKESDQLFTSAIYSFNTRERPVVISNDTLIASQVFKEPYLTGDSLTQRTYGFKNLT